MAAVLLVSQLTACATHSRFQNAIYKGDISEVRNMLDKGADVNAKVYGYTALHRVAVLG